MWDAPTEYFSRLRRSMEQTETLLRDTDDLTRRTRGVAASLRTLWPMVPLVSCRLGAEEAPLLVLDHNGQEQPNWLPPLAAFVSQHEIEDTPPRYLAALPAELPHPGYSLAVQHLEFSGRTKGLLMVAVADTAAPEKTALLWELLRVYSGWLATQLTVEEERRETAHLRQVFAEQTELADLAALASPVTHEFNNFLNTLILQLLVLANQVPEQFRGDLRAIGQQAKTVAGLVRQWQQHRAQHRSAPRKLDLNALLREVAEKLVAAMATSATPLVFGNEGDSPNAPTNGVQLRLSLAAHLPPVEGTALDLRLLLRLLIRNAAATITSPPGSVSISTKSEGNTILITVEDTGAPIPPAMLPRMFEPAVETREGASQLEMAACEALVQRRLRGRIHGENRPEGGVVIHVRLRPA